MYTLYHLVPLPPLLSLEVQLTDTESGNIFEETEWKYLSQVMLGSKPSLFGWWQTHLRIDYHKYFPTLGSKVVQGLLWCLQGHQMTWESIGYCKMSYYTVWLRPCNSRDLMFVNLVGRKTDKQILKKVHFHNLLDLDYPIIITILSLDCPGFPNKSSPRNTI